MERKPTILFVGSFKSKSMDGSVGGQMFACNTLLKSDFVKEFNWILLDTTALSNKKSFFFIRLLFALKRLIFFSYYTLFNKIDKYLIFVGDGWSFWEKGVMVLIAKFFTNAVVILAPRSGFIENDILNNIFLKEFIKYVFKKSDKVVCQSLKWKNLFVDLIKSKGNKFVVIENGIDLSSYKNIPLKGHDKCSILFLSWVDKNKGIFDLLEAMLLLLNDNLSFKLIIAGNGSAFMDSQSFVNTNNLNEYVFFHGWALGDQKLELFKNSDIFILPTHFEGYPNSLLEAMASGKACIGTLVGSIPDIIINESTGLLINKNSPIEIYKALKRLIINVDLRISLSIAARKVTQERNSIDLFSLKFKKLLSE